MAVSESETLVSSSVRFRVLGVFFLYFVFEAMLGIDAALDIFLVWRWVGGVFGAIV